MDLTATLAAQMGFTSEAIERMHEAALSVLDEIGMAVENAAALKVLSDAGVHVVGDRAFFEPAFVQEQLDAIRRVRDRARRAEVARAVANPAPSANCGRGRITINVGDMCQYYHCPFSDDIRLMSTVDLIQATQCVESMRGLGLSPYVPGVPRDVSHELQAITEFRIGAEFTRQPTLDTLHPPSALPFLFDMADALGQPLLSGGMFSVSPLRLSGYEFDIAVRHAQRWQRFWLVTYPILGATAPVRPRAAWVLSIAEALGGAVTLHLVGRGKPVFFSVGMFPFDLHTFAVVGGMPECAWMFWASAQVTRHYDPSAGYSMMLGTQAKRPGAQAGLEKGMAATFGAITGCDDLHYAGVLSFDDIFSPLQLVLDCELRDAVEHLAQGIPRQDPAQWIEDIREGYSGGYTNADVTLDRYRDTYWFPNVLDRLTWHSFQERGARTARQGARERVRGFLDAYDYHPPQPEIQDVRRVFADAWEKLGGDRDASYLRLLYNDGSARD